MKIDIDDNIDLPEGVTVTYENNTLTVSGPKGNIVRNAIIPKLTIKQEGTAVKFKLNNGSKRQKTIVNTYKAHIKNMVKGVTEGHTYKLKICSGHFPMSASLKGQTFEIKNFIGEKVPRTVSLPEDVNAKIDGEIITLEGHNKEHVGLAAGRLEQLTRRPGFDKRIFQDGIYIIEKDGKKL